MTVQSVSLADKQETMTKFGYPTSVLSREPTRFLNRDATKVIALNREATKHNSFNGPERVKPIINNRKGERSEKKWPIRGWEVESCTDDEIVNWMKKQTQLEGKRAAKKKPSSTETEHFIPANNRCPGLEDLDNFMKQSLHSSFLPKEQLSVNKTNPTSNSVKNKNQYQPVKSDNVNDKDEENGKVCVGVGVITPVGFTERFENIKDSNTDRAKDEIKQYKEAKASGTEQAGFARERRSRSVPESLNKNNRDKADQRSTAYHKIKRFLKLSKFDDRRLSVKLEDDEDEGYASKTSSAETKEELEVPQLHRMYSSMIDLSELPSQENAKENDKQGKQDAESKVKFSYTHQASILHIPETETKLQLQRERPERVSNTTYTRLKREKELRRCSTTLDELPHQVETSMYNIDNIKPMTLVLRKISIQDSEERIKAIIPGGKWTSQQTQNVAQSQPNSRASSRAGSRAGSAASQVGTTALRIGSAVSRSSSVLSKTSAQDNSPRVPTRPSSRLSMRGNTFKEDAVKTKEPTWCPKHSHVSLFNRQPTTYSIGDLLPAVDKNIYNKQIAKVNDSPRKRMEEKSNNFHDHAKSSHDDGYMLLQKGMDILTGNTEKPTLGPPPFRPNQTRHPLIRSVTVVVEQSDRSFSPIHVGHPAKVRSPPARVSSDKGPRPNMYEDRDTQKKLKEAFTRFYQNRPKDIGKEFRRMQTMWKA